jgi:hypothetical protein
MATVYLLNHNVMHEGSQVVGVYATQQRADEEANKLNSKYISERTNHWNKLSKADQRMYGPLNSYIDREGWSVEPYEVIE